MVCLVEEVCLLLILERALLVCAAARSGQAWRLVLLRLIGIGWYGRRQRWETNLVTLKS